MSSATKKSRRRPKSRSKNGSPADDNLARILRRKYGISQSLLARLMDVSLRTVSATEAAPALPPEVRRSFTQIDRLCSALAEAMDATFVGHWLDQPNEMLDGLKPVEAVERGKIDLIWQVAEGLRNGSQL